MTVKAYIGSMSTLVMSIWFVPDWAEILKVYVITVVVLVTVVINLIFRIAQLRGWIINHLVASVMQEILKDRDIQKLIHWEERRRRVREQLQEELRKRDAQSKQTPPR